VSEGRTLSEVRWPRVPEFTGFLRRWRDDAETVMLGLIWVGYDALREEVFEDVDTGQADEELERDVTQLLVTRMGRAMGGFEPFDVVHGPYENETRKPPPAQPPQYDIAFVLRSNPRAMWPVEAKALRTDSSTAAYVRELRENYLTCRYAPFSAAGAMVGYLFSGKPTTVFERVAERVPCSLTHHPGFPGRPHRVSDHSRAVPDGKPYPRSFRCHHLILEMAPA